MGLSSGIVDLSEHRLASSLGKDSKKLLLLFSWNFPRTGTGGVGGEIGLIYLGGGGRGGTGQGLALVPLSFGIQNIQNVPKSTDVCRDILLFF